MNRITRLLTSLVTTAVVVAGMSVVSTAPVAATPDNYTPANGAKFNHPLQDARRRTIYQHLLRSINSTPRKSEIRIMTWNLKSQTLVNAMIRAHKRGVSVQLIVARGNANPENPNPSFRRLRANLVGDENRPKERRSWARVCNASCRGGTGIAHTKMFLFSEVGKAHDVVMFGSANATEVAATHQWNDLFTVRNRPGLYARSLEIFNEMSLDEKVKEPYQTFLTGQFEAIWFPYWYGTHRTGDPTLDELRRTRCQGSTTASGKTVIRIGMTAWLGQTGEDVANRLKTMWNRGCDVKIVYAVIGNRILKILRNPGGRGAIPMRQIVQDFDADGIYDRYLHMKVLTIHGVVGEDTSATVTWNGSANWTPVSLKSDEMGMRILAPGVRTRYATWIDYLFANPPYNPAVSATTTERSATLLHPDEAPLVEVPGVDPYSEIEFN